MGATGDGWAVLGGGQAGRLFVTSHVGLSWGLHSTGFQSCFCHLLARRPWGHSLTSLGLSFFICKMEGVTMPTPRDCWRA